MYNIPAQLYLLVHAYACLFVQTPSFSRTATNVLHVFKSITTNAKSTDINTAAVGRPGFQHQPNANEAHT